MKSSLIALTLVGSLVLSGCFKDNSQGCTSCAEETTEVAQCSACPTGMNSESLSESLMEENMSAPAIEEVVMVEEK